MIRCTTHGGSSSKIDKESSSPVKPLIDDRLSHFVCQICSLIVRDPQECQNCNSLFCQDCLELWSQQHEYRPKKCQGVDGTGKMRVAKVNRYVLTDLQDLKFKCKMQDCGYKGKYLNMLEHMGTCQFQVNPCTKECGLGIIGCDMDYHLHKQCPNMTVFCEKCEMDIYPNS